MIVHNLKYFTKKFTSILIKVVKVVTYKLILQILPYLKKRVKELL